MKIRDLMSRDIQVARPQDPIQEVAARMAAGDFGFVPVAEAGADTLIGTITDRDIVLRAVAMGKPASTPVAEVMTVGATTVLDTDDPKVALDRMAADRIRRLPVLDKTGRLVGVVSLGDLAARVKEKSTGEALEAISRSG